MNKIWVKGAVKLSLFRPFVIPIALVFGLLTSDISPFMKKIPISFVFGYYIIWAVLFFIPMKVIYDRDRLEIKHFGFKREIAIGDISSATYYTTSLSMPLGRTGRVYFYYIVLMINYNGKSAEMMERIYKEDVKLYEQGIGSAKLFQLYKLIETENPFAADGYFDGRLKKKP